MEALAVKFPAVCGAQMVAVALRATDRREMEFRVNKGRSQIEFGNEEKKSLPARYARPDNQVVRATRREGPSPGGRRLPRREANKCDGSFGRLRTGADRRYIKKYEFRA
jgi:hypothetical protein